MPRAQLDDQGLVQADPRNIAVPDQFPNMIPTDIRGLTFSRTPQMVRRSLLRTAARALHGAAFFVWQLPPAR